MKPSQEKNQPLQTAAISPPPSEFHPQNFEALPQTPSSTSLIKKEKDKITQYYASRNMKLSQVDSRPAQSSVISKSPTVTQPQIFQRVPQTTSSSSLTKVRITQTFDSIKTQPSQEQGQFLPTSDKREHPTTSPSQTLQRPSQTAFSRFLSKNMGDRSTQTYDSRMKKSFQEWIQGLPASDMKEHPAASPPHTLQRPSQTLSSSSLTKGMQDKSA
ncbi:PREDICTED: probable serine/threonine-protein kinase samkC [Galeopterus variegatus]|uniref:Probable serine/threonine-protein kinase samkC n=1 Tax=Galeopterus variegatus TaxID=482537 RepID=A0ABM0RZZ2_GALVR|nr:PREDICTED: probable serine/threonine-protein kinase samkC [Galeopterus variegatus]